VASRRLAGTDDAEQLFWSPDSRYVGFVAGGKLKKVEAVGGPPQDVADAKGFTGGTWNRDGIIVFGTPAGLFRVSAEGGQPEAVTTVKEPETGHFWPSFLPDGRHFLYQVWASEAGNRAIFAGALDSTDKTRLMPAESNITYVEPGYVVFHREATIFAQPFDAESRAFTGDAVQLAGGVAYDQATGRGFFDVSQTDVLVYFQGSAGGGGTAGRGQTAATAQFGWLGRNGQFLGGAGDSGPYGDMDLSPDGRLIAVTRQEAGASGADVWVVDWQRAGVATRLTLDPADDINPVWSSDGSRIAFTTYRKGNADIYVKNANGVGPETPLIESSSDEVVEAWSRDGRHIAYLFGRDNVQDIYALPLSGDGKAFPVVEGPYQKNEPQFSYDGKWLAYTSNESGTFQVYVLSFPAGDEKLQVSTAGGGQPRWRQDGKELYYRALDNQIMAVEIKPGSTLESGVPRPLLTPIVNSTMTRDPVRHQLAVTPDGERFLTRVPTGQAAAGRGQSGTPQAPFIFVPPGQTAGGIRGRAAARGFQAGNAGLTVVRNWTALARKAGR
jgi:Tol biopolymer transport system component